MSTEGFILVVDDDEAIRAALEDALQNEGYGVRSARNGKEAMDLLATGEKPSAILLDLTMPVMDGWTFRALQLQDERLRIIPTCIMSAFGHGLRPPPSEHFLAKPIDLEVLFEAVERLRRPH
jgi:CheY-like chemotaxis protein